jgi:hypothetical protein
MTVKAYKFVMLSEAKHLTIAMNVFSNDMRIDEVKRIYRSVEVSIVDVRSLASLGMTEK